MPRPGALDTVRRLGELTQCENAAPDLLEEGVCRGLQFPGAVYFSRREMALLERLEFFRCEPESGFNPDPINAMPAKRSVK